MYAFCLLWTDGVCCCGNTRKEGKLRQITRRNRVGVGDGDGCREEKLLVVCRRFTCWGLMGGLLLSESLACRTRSVSVMVAYIAVSCSIDRRLLFGAGTGYAPS